MPGDATLTPATLVDGSFESTSMLLGVVECPSGGFDGVVVRSAGGFEDVEFVDS